MSRPTQDTCPASPVYNTGLSPSMAALPRAFFYQCPLDAGPTTPVSKLTGLGLYAFARRYLRNLCDFFSCRYLDVSVPYVRSSVTSFSSPGYLYFYRQGCPIRKPPGRSLHNSSPENIAVWPRPSSPLTAKGFTMCP